MRFFVNRGGCYGLPVLLAVLCLVCTGCKRQSKELEPLKLVDVGKREITVEDGDTFFCRGERVRMLGIDTAEMDSPYHYGNQEPYGTQARDFLQRQVDQAGSLSIIRIEQRDPYNRLLAYLLADGKNVNATLVGAGLAYETISYYGKQGMDEYAEQVLAAAEHAPKPPFDPPHEFRKRNRRSG